MIPKNLGTLFRETVERFPQKKAILVKEGDHYESISWSEFSTKVEAIASGFLAQGVEPGERIAILSENRPEWAMVDLAALMIGAISVPIYPSLTSTEIDYILRDSAASFVAVSNKSNFEKIIPIQKALPTLRAVVAFDSSLSVSQDQLTIPLFLIRDLERTSPNTAQIQQRLDQTDDQKIASIIYTSGTTGFPKGVMLTHANFIHNVVLTKTALKMSDADTHLSFLPLCHVFERMAGYYLMVHIGATIAYAQSMDTVSQNLLEVHPTFILGVPRFYEKIQQRVLEAVDKGGGLKKAIFVWAKELGRIRRMTGKTKKLQYALANILVYKKFKQRLGGRVRFCVSGGAPLAKEIAEFFYDLGIQIYEGYGLTETSPVISANRQDRFKFGTVGIPLEGVEVKIDTSGEILTKSPCVMKGYYEKPLETQAALDSDGWFHTGDLGMLDSEGFLSITGRKKELIVTSGGKKVSPRPIEEKIESDPLILRCVLFGEARRFITALIVPQEEMLTEYARHEKIVYQNYVELLKNQRIHQLFESRIVKLTEDLANFEKIKYFALLAHDFSQDTGELTPTLKVKRDVVFSKYGKLLEPFYDLEKGPADKH